MINLGNIYLVQRQFKQAADQFQKLLKSTPKDPVVLIGAALAADGLGDRSAAGKAFEGLKSADPGMAEKYAFLGTTGSDSTARAAAAESTAGRIVWQE